MPAAPSGSRGGDRSRDVARAVGAGRCAIGATMLAAPVLTARVLGTDTGTARRTSWIVRLAGGRDLVLGGLTLAGADGPTRRRDLLAGVTVDLVDAAVVAGAVRSGRLGRVRGGLVIVLALTGVATGAVAVAGSG